MKPKNACSSRRVYAAAMLAVFALAGYVRASLYETSWIFRSPVVQGQSMWGPGTLESHNFSGQYFVTTWPISGTGFSWAVQTEQGVVSGNVEGLVKAKYDSYSTGTNTTTINLSYGALADESNIKTSLAVSLTATPRFRLELLPWPFPAIDVSVPVSALNMAVGVDKDYAGVLGQTISTTGNYKVLPFSFDLAIANAHLDFTIGQDILFTPNSISGSVICTHMESGATRTVDAILTTDGADVAIDLPLDLKGHWEIDLNNFCVNDNLLQQSLTLGADLGIGVPMLGADWSIAGGFSLYRSDFALAFENHGSDGNPATDDNLGRFWIYVDPTIPEPATAALLVSGLGLLHLRRKARN